MLACTPKGCLRRVPNIGPELFKVMLEPSLAGGLPTFQLKGLQLRLLTPSASL